MLETFFMTEYQWEKIMECVFLLIWSATKSLLQYDPTHFLVKIHGAPYNIMELQVVARP